MTVHSVIIGTMALILGVCAIAIYRTLSEIFRPDPYQEFEKIEREFEVIQPESMEEEK